MATDYSLNLKANLDISDVEQKIRQLRQEMAQFKDNTLGGTNNQYKTPERSNSVNDNLNSALKSLQHSIDKLNTTIQSWKSTNNNISSRNYSRSNSVGNTYVPNIYTQAELPEYKKKISRIIEKGSNKKPSENIGVLPSKTASHEVIMDKINQAINKSKPFDLKRFQNIERVPFQDDRPRRWYDDPTWKTQAERRKENQDYMHKQLAPFALNMAFSQAANMLPEVDWISNSNLRMATEGTQAVNAGIAGWSSASMAGAGPIGIAAAALGMAVTSISQSMVEYADEISDAQTKASQTLKQGTDKIRVHVEKANMEQWKTTYGYAATSNQKYELNDVRSRLDVARKNYYGMTSGADNSIKAAAQNYLKEINDLGPQDSDFWSGADNSWTEKAVAIEQKYGDAVVAYAKKLDAAQKELDNLIEKEAFLAKAIGDRTSGEESRANILKNAENFEEGMFDFYENRDINKAIKGQDIDTLNIAKGNITKDLNAINEDMADISLGGGLDAWETETNKLRKELETTSDPTKRDKIEKEIKERDELAEAYKENAEKLKALTAKLDGIDNALERIKKARDAYKEQAGDILTGISRGGQLAQVESELFDIQYDKNGNPTRTSKLEKFKQASGLLDSYRASRKEQLDLAMSKAEQANGEGITNDEREQLLKESQNALNSANQFGLMVGKVEAFMSQLGQTNGWKPDLTNTTSLAQYGFGMGETNDNVNRMERYYTNMEDLTREIRNKLQDGIKTESQYA